MSRWMRLCALCVLLGACDATSNSTESPARPDADPIADTGLDQASIDAGLDAGDVEPDSAGLDQTLPDRTVDAVAQDAGTDSGPACMPPLSFDRDRLIAAPNQIRVLPARGGSGQWRFDLVEAGAGGTVNAQTGAYLAGPSAGLDIVELRDARCADIARIEVEVAEPLALQPAEITLPPQTEIEFDVQGGSGQWAWRMLINTTGGALDGARYMAGAQDGADVIELLDLETGERADAVVIVDANADLRLSPERLFLVLGAQAPVLVDGGSGALQLAVDGDAVQIDPETRQVQAVAPGQATIRVVDRFTGVERSLPVQVAAPLDAERQRGARLFHAGRWHRADLDDDGHPELVLGNLNAWVAGPGDGGIFIYRGTPDGVDPEPVQVLHGAAEDLFGSGFALADVVGDDAIDLIAGAMRAEGGNFDSGHVRIHAGRGDGTFEPAPARTLIALGNRDELGAAIEVCDIDGDALPDLIAGLRGGGAVWIFNGRPDGYADVPDRILRPQLPDDAGGWAPAEAQGFGAGTIIGADVDGDARCDLFITRTGAVMRYLADDLDADDPVPSAGWIAEAIPDFGTAIALADLPAPSLVVGAPSAADQNGAVFVFDPAAHGIFGPDAARFRLDGTPRNRLGVALDRLPVANGDTLVVGASSGGPPERADAGQVQIWQGGVAEARPPDVVFSGGERRIQFGASAAAVSSDPLAVVAFASGDQSLGYRVGQPWQIDTDGEMHPLEFPGAAGAGMRIGQGLAAIPHPNGTDDLIVGAPFAQNPYPGAGAVWMHSNDAQPEALGWTEQLDGWGDAMAVGDFDGDGWPDVAVRSANQRRARQPADPMRFVEPADCLPHGQNTGAIHIHRGGPEGITPGDPAWSYWKPVDGPRVGQPAFVDIDGDGRDELVVHSFQGTLRDAGDVHIVAGRVADPQGRSHIICTPELRWQPPLAHSFFGESFAALGDLDGDGCAEFALGAHGEPGPLGIRHGAVRVIFGWGGPGCPDAPRTVTLSPDAQRQSAGTSLAAGDLNDDGRFELAISGPEANWVEVIDLEWVLDLPRHPLAVPAVEVHPLRPPNVQRIWAQGVTGNEQFGSAMHIAHGQLVVGYLRRSLSDAVRAVGGADLFELRDGALQQTGAIVGQTQAPGGLVGTRLVGTRTGIAISGPGASILSPNAGAVFRFDIRLAR